MKYIVLLFLVLSFSFIMRKNENFTSYRNNAQLINTQHKTEDELIKIPENMEYIIDNGNHILKSVGRIIYKLSSQVNVYNSYTIQLKHLDRERVLNTDMLDDQYRRIYTNKKMLHYLKNVSSTNKRLDVLENKTSIKNNKRIDSIKKLLIVAAIMIIIPVIGFFNLIDKTAALYLWFIGILICVLIFVFYNLDISFNRDKQYLSKYNFNKPTEEEILRSRLEYERQVQKEGLTRIDESAIENDPRNMRLSINQYINVPRNSTCSRNN